MSNPERRGTPGQAGGAPTAPPPAARPSAPATLAATASIEPDAPGLEEQDDRRAHLERSQLLPLLHRDRRRVVPPLRPRPAQVGHRDLPVVEGPDPAHHRRPDRHQGAGARRRLLHRHQPLVDGEEPGHRPHRGRVDRPEPARQVPPAGDLAAEREVDPVVVARREVDGQIGAPLEPARPAPRRPGAPPPDSRSPWPAPAGRPRPGPPPTPPRPPARPAPRPPAPPAACRAGAAGRRTGRRWRSRRAAGTRSDRRRTSARRRPWPGRAASPEPASG